jgi:hypothetical protein
MTCMESVLPPQTEHGAGFDLARVRQFTIFLENRVGRLQALLSALESGAHSVRALSIEESADSALVRIVCANPDSARQTLTDASFPFGEIDLLAVQIPKRSAHPLIAICSALLAAEINIHYVYPFLTGPHGPALALYVDDPVLGAQLLMRKGFTLIGQNDLRE